ncbi:hypothetical protein [Bernardetia sp. MNP-M8]|uniref:hypothetical protein n=1 Tax=Bernardetia sp. MNP-M8 TaxID=3127470 RepID=UPI0030CF707D
MENQYYTKATTLEEIDNAVRFDVPIGADHPFFTDFSEVRGDFEDRMIYRVLNVNPTKYTYNLKANQGNKTLLFLAGMRGSGKTSELAKIAQKIHNKEAFFCVTCNIDDGLDLNDMEYMDILIFQLERLFEELRDNQMIFETPIVASLQKWFTERVEEANRVIKREGGFELELQAGTPKFLSFLSITSKIKANLLGSKENAKKLRTVFKNNFREFALLTNNFIGEINMYLRNNDKAKEILFIVDGLEKTASLDIRKKLIVEESERIKQIKVNSIFTLPVELMPEGRKLESFSTLVSFPFVKIINKDGSIVEQAIKKFIEFTYKRIDKSLFDSEDTVRKAIMIGGGSPREYLRVLEYANYFIEEEKGVIDEMALQKGIKKLAAQISHYISEEDLELLKLLRKNNEQQIDTPYGEKWHDLIEKLIILEYNDGTYKRVNPIVEESNLYKQYVLEAE